MGATESRRGRAATSSRSTGGLGRTPVGTGLADGGAVNVNVRLALDATHVYFTTRRHRSRSRRRDARTRAEVDARDGAPPVAIPEAEGSVVEAAARRVVRRARLRRRDVADHSHCPVSSR
jgi:hypothetical protein